MDSAPLLLWTVHPSYYGQCTSLTMHSRPVLLLTVHILQLTVHPYTIYSAALFCASASIKHRLADLAN